MKKLISILLCAALLLACVSALAEDKAVIDFQNRIQFSGVLPDGYKCSILSQSDLTMECLIASENPAAPRMDIFISFNESYTGVASLADLDADSLERLKMGFSEENVVTFDNLKTDSGADLLVVRETGDDLDFLDFYTICLGHEIEFTLTAGEPGQALTDEQVSRCIEFMRDLSILPVQG